MAYLLKTLAHVNSTTSSVNVAYQPSNGAQGIVTDIIISNVGTVTASTISCCVTANGTAITSTCAIVWNTLLDTANRGLFELHFHETHGINLTNAGSIGVGGTANFLILGFENII